MQGVDQKVAVIDIISPLILQSKAKNVRFWLTDLIEKFKKRNCTILAQINPEIHVKEDVRMVADIFDGEIELIEVVEKAAKYLQVKRLSERSYKKEPIRIS